MSTTLKPIRPKPTLRLPQGTYEHTSLPRDPLQEEGKRKRKRESGLRLAVSPTPSLRDKDRNSQSHIAPRSLSPGLSSSSSSSRSSSRSTVYPVPHPQVCHPNPISIPTKTDSGPYPPIPKPKPKPKHQITPCVCECIGDDIDYPSGPAGLMTKNLLRVVVEYQKSIYAWQALAERNRREAEGWKWLVCRDSPGDVDDIFLNIEKEGEEEIPKLGREFGYGGNSASAGVSGWYSVMSSRMDRQERRRLELEHECWILRDKILRLESLIMKRDEPREKGVYTGPRLTLDVVAETSRGRGQGRGQGKGGSTRRIEELYLSPRAQRRNGHNNAELENEAESVFVHQLFPGLACLPSSTEIESDYLPPTPISNPIPTPVSVEGPERIPDFELPNIDADSDNENEDAEIDYGPYLLTPANFNSKWTESNSPISPLFEPAPSLDPRLNLPLTPISMISESLSDRPSPNVVCDTSFNGDSSCPSKRSASGSPSAAKTSGLSCAVQAKVPSTDIITETDIDTNTATNDDDLRSRSSLEGFVDWAQKALALIEREREYDRVRAEQDKEGEGSIELDQLEWTWGLIREFQDCVRSIVMVDEIEHEDESVDVLS